MRFSALPFLGNSEAIAIGEGMPMRLRFAEMAAGERSRSSAALFSARWQDADDKTGDELSRIVNALPGCRAA
jgi:hypothetical protein